MKCESEKEKEIRERKGIRARKGIRERRNQVEQEPMTKNESMLQRAKGKSASEAFSDSLRVNPRPMWFSNPKFLCVTHFQL
jgi:hypothetical protein